MELTMMLASYIGPILLVLGLGFLVSKDYYRKVYKRLDDETLAMYLITILMLVFGLFVVTNHNLWGSLEEVIVSVIGWGTLIKGIILGIAPRHFEKLGEKWVTAGLINAYGVIMVVVGAYLTLGAFGG